MKRQTCNEISYIQKRYDLLLDQYDDKTIDKALDIINEMKKIASVRTSNNKLLKDDKKTNDSESYFLERIKNEDNNVKQFFDDAKNYKIDIRDAFVRNKEKLYYITNTSPEDIKYHEILTSKNFINASKTKRGNWVFALKNVDDRVDKTYRYEISSSEFKPQILIKEKQKEGRRTIRFSTSNEWVCDHNIPLYKVKNIYKINEESIEDQNEEENVVLLVPYKENFIKRILNSLKILFAHREEIVKQN